MSDYLELKKVLYLDLQKQYSSSLFYEEVKDYLSKDTDLALKNSIDNITPENISSLDLIIVTGVSSSSLILENLAGMVNGNGKPDILIANYGIPSNHLVKCSGYETVYKVNKMSLPNVLDELYEFKNSIKKIDV